MKKGIDCKGREWEERQLFGKMIDISGRRFERLTVLFPVTSNKQKVWLCKCDCGNYTVVLYNSLMNNNTKSCGCLQKEAVLKRLEEFRINDIGKKFGRLTALEFVCIENDEAIYKFQCDCGNVVETTMHSVKSGNTKSCGCLKRDYLNIYKEDIIGQKFGHLLVTAYCTPYKYSDPNKSSNTIVSLLEYGIRTRGIL